MAKQSGRERGIAKAKRERGLQTMRNLIQLSEQGKKPTRTQADRLGVDPVTQLLKRKK